MSSLLSAVGQFGWDIISRVIHKNADPMSRDSGALQAAMVCVGVAVAAVALSDRLVDRVSPPACGNRSKSGDHAIGRSLGELSPGVQTVVDRDGLKACLLTAPGLQQGTVSDLLHGFPHDDVLVVATTA